MYRREAVALAGVAALAGCLGGSDDEEEEDADAIDLSFDGLEMTVEIDSDDDIDELTISNDDGEEVYDLSMTDGTGSVEIRDIHDGTYTFTGYDGGDEVVSIEKDLVADFLVVDATRMEGAEVDLDEEPGVATGDQAEFWEPYYQLEAEVENTGDVPISLRPSRVYIDEPVSVPPATFSHSGVDEADFPRGELIEPGETTTITTEGSTLGLDGPFMAEGEEKEDLGVPENETEETVLYVYDERGERHDTEVEIDYGELHLARDLSNIWTWLRIDVTLLE